MFSAPYDSISVYYYILHSAFIRLHGGGPVISLPLHASHALLRCLHLTVNQIEMDNLPYPCGHLSFDWGSTRDSCLHCDHHISVGEEDCASWNI